MDRTKKIIVVIDRNMLITVAAMACQMKVKPYIKKETALTIPMIMAMIMINLIYLLSSFLSIFADLFNILYLIWIANLI